MPDGIRIQGIRVMYVALLAGAFAVAQPLPSGARKLQAGGQPSATVAGAVPAELSQPGDAAGYVLGPGDQIVIHAPNAPEINDKNVRVDLRGEIKMRTEGRIHAAGVSPKQL